MATGLLAALTLISWSATDRVFAGQAETNRNGAAAQAEKKDTADKKKPRVKKEPKEGGEQRERRQAREEKDRKEQRDQREQQETAVKPEKETEKKEAEPPTETESERKKAALAEEKKLRLEYQRNEEMSRIRRLFLSGRIQDMARSLKAYGQAYKTDSDKEYYFYNGAVLESAGEYRNAVESYLRAIEIAPDFARARNSLGGLYCRLHKHRFALSHFQKALEVNPYNPFIQYNMGCLYFDTGDLKNAQPYLERAVRYKANFGSAYHKLGVIALLSQ